jgi:hypothetical protein
MGFGAGGKGDEEMRTVWFVLLSVVAAAVVVTAFSSTTAHVVRVWVMPLMHRFGETPYFWPVPVAAACAAFALLLWGPKPPLLWVAPLLPLLAYCVRTYRVHLELDPTRGVVALCLPPLLLAAWALAFAAALAGVARLFGRDAGAQFRAGLILAPWVMALGPALIWVGNAFLRAVLPGAAPFPRTIALALTVFLIVVVGGAAIGAAAARVWRRMGDGTWPSLLGLAAGAGALLYAPGGRLHVLDLLILFGRVAVAVAVAWLLTRHTSQPSSAGGQVEPAALEAPLTAQ